MKVKAKSPTQPAKRQQLTLDRLRKECIRDIRGTFSGFRCLHIWENNNPVGYDFVPNGIVYLKSKEKYSTTWLSSDKHQQKGEFIFILGMMRTPYATNWEGKLFSEARRALWRPWSLQVCDGNVLASNCLNTKAYLEAPRGNDEE